MISLSIGLFHIIFASHHHGCLVLQSKVFMVYPTIHVHRYPSTCGHR